MTLSLVSGTLLVLNSLSRLTSLKQNLKIVLHLSLFLLPLSLTSLTLSVSNSHAKIFIILPCFNEVRNQVVTSAVTANG